MFFVFRPEHMIGLANGTLKQVVSSSGIPLSMVRDANTGHIVGHAVGVITEPFLALPQLIMDSAQMIQVHRGFQKTYEKLDLIQSSLTTINTNISVLQATTALIGVGAVAGLALSAVNLHQILRLREDIKQLKLEVKHGFIDLKKALDDRGKEIINHIDRVAQDIKFEQHRLVMIQAYGKFQAALNLIKTALKTEASIRNTDLATARHLLTDALEQYRNQHLLSETRAAGYLRRVECSWAIDQTIILTYQLQNQPTAVSDRLIQLQEKIRQDSLSVVEQCESEEELDFLFPEIAQICDCDLILLESWQHHVDWIQSLSPDERQLIAKSNNQFDEVYEDNQNTIQIAEPEEISLSNRLKQKSHYLSLRDQLKFMILPNSRKEYETYITQQALATKYKGFAPSNWQELPDLTVANLYWYFKAKKQ